MVGCLRTGTGATIGTMIGTRLAGRDRPHRPHRAPGEHPSLRRLGDVVSSLAMASLAMVPRPGIAVAVALLLLALVVGWGPRGLMRGGLVLVAMLGIQLVAAVVTPESRDIVPLGGLPSALLRAGAPWLVAVAWFQRVQIRRDARDAAVQAQRRRRALADDRRSAERLALAEDLHDDLGHALSLVALNLGALELRRDLAPDVSAQITTAREELTVAVGRLGSSVASLRAGAERRAPRRAGPAEVVARARHAGMRVQVTGGEARIRARRSDGELLARVLQEALTNAAKHAPGESVQIDLAERRDVLRVVVRNRARPADGQDGEADHDGGTGLAALDQSLRDVDGRLSCRTVEGEFVLEALVPAGEPDAGSGCTTTDDDATDAAADEAPWAFQIAAAAQRKGALVLLGAALVIVLALCVVELATKGLP